MTQPRPSTFDNTEVILTFSKQNRNGKDYWLCMPDLDVDLPPLTEMHIVFDPERNQLRISRNRKVDPGR